MSGEKQTDFVSQKISVITDGPLRTKEKKNYYDKLLVHVHSLLSFLGIC